MRLSIRWKCNKSTSTKNSNSKIFNCYKQKLLHELHTPQNILCEQIISWAWNQKFGIHITLWSAVFPVRKSKRWPFHNTWCCSSPCFEVILALIILPEFIDFGFEILCSAVQLCRQNCVLCRESISLLFLPYNIYHITNHATTKSPPPCFHVLTTCLLIWESW